MLVKESLRNESSIGIVGRLNAGSLLEPETNSIASDYCVKHWSSLVKGAIKFGASWDKAEDLVQDMMINLLVSEREGDCFDIYNGNKYDTIDVEHMIWGRLKLYAKNKKYHKHTMNTSSSNEFIEIPSCSNFDDDSESLNSAQFSYATAGDVDRGIDDVEMSVSIKKDIEDIVYGPGILRNFLKNIDYFVNNLDSIDLKGIFGGFHLKESEYADSLRNILGLYSIKPNYVNSLIVEVMTAGEFE